MNAVPKAAPASGAQTMTMVRTFYAPRALVWQAWTDPKHLKEWWGPHYFTNGAVDIDLKVGGIQRIEMIGPGGTSYPMESEYREIAPPDRLVLLNRILKDESGEAQLEILTTVTFAEENGRTTLTVFEEVLKATAAAAGPLSGLEEGMNQTLDRLGHHVGSLVLAVPEDEPILWMTRIFDAPRALVWKALTEPEHLRQWWGQKNATNIVCEMDTRPGGKWRIHQRYDGPESAGGAPAGTVFKFRGEVLEVVPPEKIVQTFGMEGMFEDKIIVETLTLTEINGRTIYKVVSKFQSFEDRAGMIATGMSYGAQETMDRLGEHLRTM